jgi:DNA polymerase
VDAESLDKKAVKNLCPIADGEVLEMLKLRHLMAKTSVKKYQAIECSALLRRARHGLLQFYGANRTADGQVGSSRFKTSPQNHIPDWGLPVTS